MRKKRTSGKVTLGEIMLNIKKTGENCFEWTGSVARNGYGQIRRNGKLITVTRLIMHLVHGFNLKSKKFILHHCDNPRCVNPKHLYVGNAKDNMKDKVLRNRQKKGDAIPNSVLDDNKVRRIRELHAEGLSHRAIAKLLKVSHYPIGQVLRNETWKHVTETNNQLKKEN